MFVFWLPRLSNFLFTISIFSFWGRNSQKIKSCRKIKSYPSLAGETEPIFAQLFKQIFRLGLDGRPPVCQQWISMRWLKWKCHVKYLLKNLWLVGDTSYIYIFSTAGLSKSSNFELDGKSGFSGSQVQPFLKRRSSNRKE